MQINEKKVWKLQIISERIHNLALMIAIEASRMQQASKALAVFIDEARTLSRFLTDTIEQYKFQTSPMSEAAFDSKILEFSSVLSLLSNNGTIIGTSYVKENFVAICADELHRCSIEMLREIDPSFKDTSLESELSEVADVSSITNDAIKLISFSIGGYNFSENVSFVQEILYYKGAKNFIKDGMLDLRGNPIELVDSYKILGLEKPENELLMRFIIINIPNSRCRYIAVPVDKINTIYKSKVGKNNLIALDSIDQQFIREAWDTNINKQILFLDWENIISR